MDGIVIERVRENEWEKLKEIRPYVIVGAFVVAAIVTPPDVMSQMLLAVPICLLYEIGLWVAPLFVKATQAPEEATGLILNRAARLPHSLQK